MLILKKKQSGCSKNRCRAGESGFSIIEAVVGIAILSIGILAVGAMQISAVQVNAVSRDLTRATTVAQDRMESLLTRNYNDGALQTNGTENVDGIYQVNWTITANNPVPNTRRIVVQVNWSAQGTAKSLQITGVRARLQ